MAELNVSRPDDREPERRVDSDHLLPENTDAPAPGVIAKVDDPELARLQIEQTRARMSDTIEQIETTLLRKKERIEERMDVMAPVRRTARENPLPAVAGVFLGGLLLGWLTGGDDDDREPEPAVRRFAPDFDRERSYVDHWEERARTWESRARRLMEVANRQEEELMQTRGESVPVRRGRGRLFGRGGEGRRGPRRAGTLDGMPLPPRGEHEAGYGHDPLPAPI
jgi:hypothetical protein